MIAKNQNNMEYIYYKEIDFSEQSSVRFYLDTRDFYCSVSYKHNVFKIILEGIDKNHLISLEELKALLERWETESGGRVDWRYLSLEGYDNWKLKYVEILKVGDKYAVLNKDDQQLTLDELKIKATSNLMG